MSQGRREPPARARWRLLAGSIAFCGLTAACSGPPGSRTDAAVVDAAPRPDASDAAPVDAAASDAAITDAAAGDAAIADAAIADAWIADAGPTDDAASPIEVNPFGIALTDVSAQVGTYLGGRRDSEPYGAGSGAAAGDFDDDGDLDLFLARCDVAALYPGGPSQLLRNTGVSGGAPSFDSVPAIAQIFGGRCAHAAAFADYDGDGDLDLFVAMHGPDRLLQNDGGGVFTDVTSAAGVAGPADVKSTGALWADVNADGLLDLHVLSQTYEMPPADDPRNRNRLFLNRGDGFEDVSDSAAVDGDGISHAGAIADLDGDGDLEIYIANDRFAIEGGPANQLLDADRFYDLDSYDNEGRPVYVERSVELGLDGPRSSMGIALGDRDADGRDEIYVSDFGSNHLFEWSEALGHYVDVAADAEVARSKAPGGSYFVSWGVRYADLDRDGAEELLIVNGSTGPSVNCYGYRQVDLLLRRSVGGSVFANATAYAGWPYFFPCPPPPTGMQFSGRGLVLADLDGDHDDDLVVSPFIERYAFFRNDTPATHHVLRVRPVGTVSAVFPAGASLEVVRDDGVSVRRSLFAGGATGSQSAPVVEIGLGTAAVSAAWLHWPSGYSQRLDGQPGFVLDSTWELVEPGWLTLSARVATAADPSPALTYRPVDELGAPLGPGLAVTVTRSDGVAASVVDEGDGRYTALLPHPGAARTTIVEVAVGGEVLRPRLSVGYR